MNPALKQLEAGSKGYRIVSPGPGLDWVKQPSNLYLNSVYATNTITETSTVDILIPGMVMRVPADGWYTVDFAMELTTSSATRAIAIQPYIDGTTDGFTICYVSVFAATALYIIHCTLNRGQLYESQLEMRWKASGSSTMTGYKRRMTLIRNLGVPK